MIAVGIDIGKCKHAAAVIGDDGRQPCKPAFYANDREGAERLLAVLAKVAPPPEAVIGMEATGNYWFPFHDFLVKAGYRVEVINPIVTSASISCDIRGRKSDKGDAQIIASLMRTSKRAPRRNADTDSRRLMALTRHRSFMVAQRSDMRKHLQSMLDVVFPEFHTLFDNLSAPFPMALLRAHPTAASLARAKRPALAKLVTDLTRGRNAAEEAERLISAARRSLGVDSGVSDMFGMCIVSSVESIIDMDERIAEIEEAIGDFETPELAKLIMPIKGSGKILPKTIAAEFGDISRFEIDPKTGLRRGMHKRMLAYAGSEPRIRESGKWKGSIHMSKRGSGSLRTALMQIAFTISQNDPHFKDIYDRQIKANKHHKVALSYVAAELLKIICSLWKSKRTYTVEKPAARVTNRQTSKV